MDIKLELLRGFVGDFVKNMIKDFEIDADAIANSVAIQALSEIQKIVQNDKYDDFQVVEEIVLVFEKYKLSAGSRHDF